MRFFSNEMCNVRNNSHKVDYILVKKKKKFRVRHPRGGVCFKANGGPHVAFDFRNPRRQFIFVIINYVIVIFIIRTGGQGRGFIRDFAVEWLQRDAYI